MDTLRITEEPAEIFRMVLRSLESHRPAKAERDLLDQMGERYGLPDDRKRWPDALAAAGVPVDAFLKYTLDLLGPFVEMILQIYAFLHRHVSTTGGRTQHFVIDSDDLSNPWSFDVSRLPRQVQWVRAWMDLDVEEVEIDWREILECLVNDNGIFYAQVGEKRFLQSLVTARRDGWLPDAGRDSGDRIRAALLTIVHAWYRGARRAVAGGEEPGSDAAARLPADGGEDPLVHALVPSLAEDFRGRGVFGMGGRFGGRVGIDIDVVLGSGRGDYTAEEVFRDPDSAPDLIELTGTGQGWPIQSAVFFCALWGLDEPSFRRMAGLLRYHEERGDLLGDAELEVDGGWMADAVLRRLEQAVTPTGEVASVRELSRQRLDILLLPYWKDRWFLYEVWTLLEVLGRGVRAGARLDLRGVSDAEPGVSGTVWDLPTQKAKDPVAALSAGEHELLVWFQRETRRVDSGGNMEPDIRLTTAAGPYPDLAIVECKDRIRFAGARSSAVVDSYLRGSEARLVWLVNYEDDVDAASRLAEAGGRRFGVAQQFRPHTVPAAFRSSVEGLIREELKLPLHGPGTDSAEGFLVIDISGSMNGKTLPDVEALRPFFSGGRARVKLWRESVVDPGSDQWEEVSLPPRRIRGAGVESVAAMEAFARGLPHGARITLVTDEGGRSSLVAHARNLASNPAEPRYTYSLHGRPLEIISA